MGVASIEGSRGMSRWSDRALLAEGLVGRSGALDLLWARHEGAARDLLTALGHSRTRRADLARVRELFGAQAAALVWTGVPLREVVVTLAARTAGVIADTDEDAPAEIASLVQAYRLLSVDDRALLWFRAVDRLPWDECSPMLGAQTIARAPEVAARFVTTWIAVCRARGLPPECARARTRMFVAPAPSSTPPALVHARSCLACAAVMINRDQLMDRLATLLLENVLGSEVTARLRGLSDTNPPLWPPLLTRTPDTAADRPAVHALAHTQGRDR